MSGFESFMTGLMTKTDEIVTNRKDKADNYFEQQMERAATTGAEALKTRRTSNRQITTLANNLMKQAGMPEDIVRGLANDGPEALDEAYKIYSTSVKNGVTVNEDFWRDAYDFSKEITTDGESLGDFLQKVSGLYPSNLQAVQEEGGDPFSAFVSSGLGLNAMEKARSRLETTEVADGYSARDLINMSSNPQSTRPLGDTGYTLNLQAIQKAEDAAKANSKGTLQPLNPVEARREGTAFLDGVTKNGDEAFTKALQNDETLDRDSFMKDFAEKEALTWLQSYGVTNIEWVKTNIPAVYNALPEDVRVAFEKGEITDVPLEGASVPDVTTTPLEQNDQGLTVGVPLPDISDEGEVLKYKGTTPDGKVVYTYPDGTLTPPISVESIPKESFIQGSPLTEAPTLTAPEATNFPGVDLSSIPQELPPTVATPEKLTIDGENYNKYAEAGGKIIYKSDSGKVSPPYTREQAIEMATGVPTPTAPTLTPVEVAPTPTEDEAKVARLTAVMQRNEERMREPGRSEASLKDFRRQQETLREQISKLSEKSRRAPPQEVKIGNRTLVYTGKPDAENKNWIYKNSADGKEVRIPIQ